MTARRSRDTRAAALLPGLLTFTYFVLVNVALVADIHYFSLAE
ncbi:hypothetical protein DAD186_19080 [Dermabacter vaginalis]|uniref:Uncharacterized protein n=1 Tax=Dermabacter vaginalis TaxID=1630135 RepID=A0A1B0ZKP9_9MICO|nr:hypothetical protein [Dermabacter vaginalis]ANP28458.1 hypothetical protein DAD186_19080 [Dermabacter vaginalis]